jgi:hypothetical protein
MTRTRAVLLTAALLLLVPAASAQAKPSCSVKHSKTVASNSSARVFTVRSHRDDYGDILYGCLKSTGKRTRLAEDYDDNYVSSSSFDKVALNGRFAVWQYVASDVSCKADCPPDYQPTRYTVQVGDLRVRKVKAYDGQAKDTVLVTRAGTPAWLQDGVGGVEVHAGAQVLDTGVIDGLALTGNVLSWTNAGMPKSATLR